DRRGQHLAGDGVVPCLGAALGIGEVFLGEQRAGGAFAEEDFGGDGGGLAVAVEGLGDLVGDGAGSGKPGGFPLDVEEGVGCGGAVGALEGEVRQRGLGDEAGGDV